MLVTPVLFFVGFMIEFQYVALLPLESGQEVESSLNMVRITEGHTTIWEWLKSVFIPGYQPMLWGTESKPLLQYVFNNVYGLFPGIEMSAVKPTQGVDYVTQPSFYLAPNFVTQLKNTASSIWQRFVNSDTHMSY